MAKMICDKAGQFKGCDGCGGSFPHEKNDACNNEEPYHCLRANDASNDSDPLAVLVMCILYHPISQTEIDKLIEQERQAQIDYDYENNS